MLTEKVPRTKESQHTHILLPDHLKKTKQNHLNFTYASISKTSVMI